MNALANLLVTSGVHVGWGDGPASVDNVRLVYMHAGQLVATAEPTQITTILGSGVSICVWDPVSRVGGANHFMLPYDASPNMASPRYAKQATATLLVDVAVAGASLTRLQARIFGGACIFAAFRDSGHDLGAQNVDAAREILTGARVKIVGEDVGGDCGRKLVFRTDTGVANVVKVTK